MITKIVTVLAVLVVAFVFLYWLVATPKKTKLQGALQPRSSFEYQTSLVPEVSSSLPKKLLLRRVRDSEWETSGEHTEYSLRRYNEPSMSAVIIKPDAYLKLNSDEPPRILIGRHDDRGSGMHGWHVTMIRQGENPISFDRLQRYHVWIEKEFPSGFNDDGVPVSSDPKRWYFAGPADIIDDESYTGYVEHLAGDK